MRKIKPTTKYQTVSFPEPFYEEIKHHVIKNKNYRSIAEFVKHAVKEQIARDMFLNQEVPYDTPLPTYEEWKKNPHKMKSPMPQVPTNIRIDVLEKKMEEIITLLKNNKKTNGVKI